MTMTYTTITVAHDKGLATLTLNAPDKLNAVSRKMIAELKQCWEALAADTSVRAVLLTGAGRGFCAGADLSDPDRERLMSGGLYLRIALRSKTAGDLRIPLQPASSPPDRRP